MYRVLRSRRVNKFFNLMGRQNISILTSMLIGLFYNEHSTAHNKACLFIRRMHFNKLFADSTYDLWNILHRPYPQLRSCGADKLFLAWYVYWRTLAVKSTLIMILKAFYLCWTSVLHFFSRLPCVSARIHFVASLWVVYYHHFSPYFLYRFYLYK